LQGFALTIQGHSEWLAGLYRGISPGLDPSSCTWETPHFLKSILSLYASMQSLAPLMSGSDSQSRPPHSSPSSTIIYKSNKFQWAHTFSQEPNRTSWNWQETCTSVSFLPLGCYWERGQRERVRKWENIKEKEQYWQIIANRTGKASLGNTH
jgi:hypothetical protein